MVVAKYGNWEANRKAAPHKLPGLEPFVFDPGEVQSQEELVLEAQQKVQNDKSLRSLLQSRKGEVTQILQDCLDKVRDQLERGEELCTKAHFPLLNPIDFEDLDALARHDFTKDLHADVVDKIMKDMFHDFMEIVWKNVSVENVSKARSLERFNDALQSRMETLEYHLSDRARQLCNCRFAYFQEITHLRNQVYRQGIEGDKFEPEEVYYFDPSEYLEEELREQLNDKIDMSVKGYHIKLQEARRRIEDLEMQLETAGGAFRFERKKEDKLKDVVEKTLVRFKPKQVLDELNKQVPREVTAWAMNWAESNGYVKDTEVSSLKAYLDEAKEKARQLEEEMKKLREQLEEDLEAERSRVKSLSDELEMLRGEVAAEEAKRSTKTNGDPSALASSQEMDALRTQLARLKLELEKASTRAADAADEAERLAAENAEMASKVQILEGEYQKAMLSLSQLDVPQQLEQINTPTRQVSPHGVEVVKEVSPVGYETAKNMLEGLHHRYLEMRRGRSPSSMGKLGNIAGVGVADHLVNGQHDTDAEGRAEIDLFGHLSDYVKWSIALLHKKDILLKDLERRLLGIHAESKEQAALLAREQRRSALFESECSQLGEKLLASKSELDSTKSHLNAEAAKKSSEELNRRAETVGHRVANAEGCFDCETQTMIAGAGDGGFYLLEYPPTEAQEAIDAELHDLNACALGNWEATIEQIRACQRPPLGHGSGFCPRSAFIRLFQGTRQRVARMDELIEMAEKLKKAELLRTVQGVHLLMESTLPNDDVALREAIFGRGITEAALLGARSGPESAALSKKWCNHQARIVGILLQRYDDIELAMHIGRRTFMVGGGAGSSTRVAGGAAGGGLAARERKDFSPPRPPIWPGLLEQPNEVWELQELRSARYTSPRHPCDSDMNFALEGHEIPMYNMDGSSPALTRFDAMNGPYIVVAGRLVPRAGVEMLPQHGYVSGASRPHSPQRELDLSLNARTWRPDVNEIPHSAHIHRSCSPPRSRQTSPNPTCSPRRRSPTRARSPSPGDPGQLRVGGWSSAGVDHKLVHAKHEAVQQSGMARSATTAASTGDLSFVATGSSLDLGKGIQTSTSGAFQSPIEEPAAEDEVAANEAAEKLMARLRPSRGKLALAPQGWHQTDLGCDIEEPQAEPAPQSAPSQRPQRSRHPDRREREVERVRRQMCESSAGMIGPTPSWALEELAEQRRPRTAGGRHTAMESRLAEKARVQMVRSASAGRLRGNLSGPQGFRGTLASLLAQKPQNPKQSNPLACRVSSKKLSRTSSTSAGIHDITPNSVRPAVQI
eukprot:CAMPEP_0169152880 /NCGR_PEP_ID=MMETSP1015-20121227/51770_1 /TAXON_ID=342587 /ORGANISM="Karlodinium micrum, Strain CCMP2283" /LENGTH=1298 /DNA_ID=CAMNT_0009222745 /DNA_START=52 /DNA_END=3946 /DNA_ORIENTATION=+